MRLIYILCERIKSHFKNHKAVMAMFMLGVFSSTIFFTYFYGDTVKATYADEQPDMVSKYTIRAEDGFDCNDERITELEKENTVTFFYSFDFDESKSSDIFMEDHGIALDPMVCIARRTDKYGYETRYGNGDLDDRNTGVWLTAESEFFIVPEKLKNADEPYLYLNGTEMEIIGVHGLYLYSCVPFKYIEENGIKADWIEVQKSEFLDEAESNEYAAELKALFPEANSVETGYETYQEYIESGNYSLGYRIRRAMLLMLLSVFTFMFLAKYLFDMSAEEDIVYRILGTERANIALVAFGEIIILAALSITAGLVAYASLFDVFFGEISRYTTLEFVFADYLTVGLTALLTCIISCLPFIFIVWKKSAVSAKNHLE